MTPAWRGRWLPVRTALLGPWLSWISWIPAAAAGVSLVIIYLSSSAKGLWEDGYFVKRVARNFWEHGSFSWNVEDGPVYGMTSQTLQLVGTALYGLTPEHFVLSLKAVLYAALLAAVFVIGRGIKAAEPAPAFAPHSSSGAPPLLAVVGLTLSLIVQVILVGLETALALLAVGFALTQILRSRETRRDAIAIVLSALLVYLTRPDAILIPGVLLASSLALALARPSERARARFYAGTLLGIGAGLALFLLIFKLYYGTSLPLPFYIKTHGVSVQSASHIAAFAQEKLKNATQIAFFSLPFVFVACHSRARMAWGLLAAAFCFFGYHFAATIETMGHMSRFYLPGWVAVVAASGLGYPAYQARLRRGLVAWLISGAFVAAWVGAFFWLKRIDQQLGIAYQLQTALDVPMLVAMALILLMPPALERVTSLLVGAVLVIGTWLNYPIRDLAIRDDETILLAQIRPRVVFRGLERLRAIEPRVVYHTDMGAPGVLLPDTRVVDLDGLLNEDITLRGARFEELCVADQPDAIFVPNHTYPELRREVLSSECLENYRAVTPMGGNPLYIRRDRLSAYNTAR